MAYFAETKEFGEFVPPSLAPYVLNGSTVNKEDIFIVKFLFLGYEHKLLADKEFVTKYDIVNSELFDLEETGKVDVFFDLVPVPQSKYKQFLKINNIEM
jgi:hypothetical protein